MIKKTLLYVFIWGLWLPGLAQLNQTRVDSLLEVIQSRPDSLKFTPLMELIYTYQDTRRRDTAERRAGLEYTRQARTLARQFQDTLALDSALDAALWFFQRGNYAGEKDSIEAINAVRRSIAAEKGYHLPQDYKQWKFDQRYGVQDQGYIFYDATGLMGFDSLLRQQDFQPFENELISTGNRNRVGAWWIRVELTSENDQWVEHTFYTGQDQERWDSVWVYFPDESGTYQSLLTGAALPEADWNIPDYPNHFRISVPPHSHNLLYVKVKGATQTIAPNRLRLYHINYEVFLRRRVSDRHASGIFQGIVLIQLFFFFLFFLATRDKIYGNYVIYILGLCLFTITNNYLSEMASVNDLTRVSMNILSIWLCIIGMLTFSYSYLNLDTYLPGWRNFLRYYLLGLTLIVAMFILGLFVLDPFENGPETTGFILLIGVGTLVFFLFGIVSMVFLIVWGISVYRKGYSPAKYYLLATFFLLLGFILPFVVSPLEPYLQGLGLGWLANGSNVLEGSIALQLCLFALAVGHKRNLLEKERREALESNLEIQRKINEATDRFVPYEFLKKMGRESIMDVVLGDQVEKHVTVFFSDIRDYTSLSEQMTPEQNFIFLNAYLGRVGPIIKTNRGFVGQYYGDGIMALFMGEDTGVKSPQDSVTAAIEMHAELRKYNEERLDKEREAIRVGIGLHTGPLMLGVIGDEKRMDIGVVSDTVNTAARMEGLTKHYGATTLISETTFDGMENTDLFHYRFLGKVQVKGKKEPLRIYDFFDGDLEQVGALKDGTLKYFQAGLDAYFAKDFREAVRVFEEILRTFPTDLASQFYRERAQEYLTHGVPEGWTGIEILSKK